MQNIEIEAPAKINLGLRILSKRPDGFHNINTLFYPINDLTDIISIEKSDYTEFISNVDELTTGSNNLILKARNISEKLSGIKINAKFLLEKRIPIGAGLGGGSSDAAATLKGLNELFDLQFTESDLRDMALQLGSDVPFFLNPLPAIGTSRGEILESINLKIRKTIVLINPGIHISTPEIFSKVIPLKNSLEYHKLVQNNELLYEFTNSSLTNDFESIVFENYPEIKEIKRRLYSAGADFALMTGTGSTVFGLFPDLETAEKSVSDFPDSYFKFISKK